LDHGRKTWRSWENLLNTPFSEKDIALAIVGTRTEFAPRPNGFIVTFKKLWTLIKGGSWKWFMIWTGTNWTLRRFNDGVITLVPKTKEANTIIQ
jgi:hypothetical protein